jgi:hypothetical protein
MHLKNISLIIQKYKLAIWVFILSIVVIQGMAFTMMNNYTESVSPDALNYMEIAKGNFDQNPIQKYRVIIPMVAAAINYVLGNVFEKIRPWSFEGDFSLFVSFWIVNSILTALFGVVTFLLCRAYDNSIIASSVGLLALLTCRWTPYIAGLPLIDSLFCFVSVLALLGIKKKDNALLIFSIMLGPWAKESFIFVAPVIFFFASMSKLKQIAWFLLSGIFVFSFRIYFDKYTGTIFSDSMEHIAAHLRDFYSAISRLFSFHGLYEIFSVTGLWIFIPVYLMIRKTKRFKKQLKELDKFMYAYLMCVFVQALVSSELARMFYLALPVLAVYIAMSVDSLIPSLKRVELVNEI